MVEKLKMINDELLKMSVKGEDVVRMFKVLTSMPDLIAEAKTMEATIAETAEEKAEEHQEEKKQK